VIEAVYATIKPGATCGDLVRAAAAVEPKHALKHFYLGHGCGVRQRRGFRSSGPTWAWRSTTRSSSARDGVRPWSVVWRDGAGGYRSEEIVVVTDDGLRQAHHLLHAVRVT